MATVTISPSNAKDVGCGAILRQTGYGMTQEGHPGRDNGPTRYESTWVIDGVAAPGWRYTGATVTLRTSYTMWNPAYYGGSSAPAATETTITVAAGSSFTTYTETETCAIDLTDEGYHGDHHTKVCEIVSIAASFTAVNPTKVNVGTVADPSSKGTVSGGGEKSSAPGTWVTFLLEAAPKNGNYKFEKWTGSNGDVRTDPVVSLRFMTPSSGTTYYTYTAHFVDAEPSVSVQATKSVSASYWSVSPASPEVRFKTGDNTTELFQVYAWADGTPPSDPSEQYRFDHWEITSGAAYAELTDPTNPVCNVRVTYGSDTTTRAVVVQAVLKPLTPKTVVIQAETEDEDKGTVSGGVYTTSTEGRRVCATLSATPKYGYRLKNWTSSKGETASSSSFQACVTVSADDAENSVTWTAHFETNPDDPVINPPTVLTGTTDYGTQTETSGTSDVPTETGTTERSAVKVTVTCDSSQGEVNVNGPTQTSTRTGHVGQTRTFELNAYPEFDANLMQCPTYKFSGWYENGVLLSTDEKFFVSYTLQSGYSEESPEEHTIEGRFELAGPTVHLSAGTSPQVSGWTVDPSDRTFTKSGSCASHTVETISLTASADGPSDYVFVRWEATGDGVTVVSPNSQTTTVRLTYPDSAVVRDVTLTAVLEQKETACVTFAATAGKGGTVSGGGTACGKVGDSLCAPNPLVATANNGYRFVKWTRSGSDAAVSTSSSFTPCATALASHPNRTVTYVAHFERTKITVNVSFVKGLVDDGDVELGWYADPKTQTVDAPEDGSTTVSFVLHAVDAQPYVHDKVEYIFGQVKDKYDFDYWEVWESGGSSATGVSFEDIHAVITTMTVGVPEDGSDRVVEVIGHLKDRPKSSVSVTTAPSPANAGWTAGDGTLTVFVGDIIRWDIDAFPEDDSGFLWWTKGGVMQDIPAEAVVELNAPTEEGGSVTYDFVAHFLGETSTAETSGTSGGTTPTPPGPGGETTGGETSGTSGGTSGTSGTSGTEAEQGVVVFKAFVIGTGTGTVEPVSLKVKADVGETVSFSPTATAAAGSVFQEWLNESKTQVSTDAALAAYATVTSEPQVVKFYAVMAIVGPLVYGDGDGSLLHGAECAGIVYADRVIVDGD